MDMFTATVWSQSRGSARKTRLLLRGYGRPCRGVSPIDSRVMREVRVVNILFFKQMARIAVVGWILATTIYNFNYKRF